MRTTRRSVSLTLAAVLLGSVAGMAWCLSGQAVEPIPPVQASPESTTELASRVLKLGAGPGDPRFGSAFPVAVLRDGRVVLLTARHCAPLAHHVITYQSPDFDTGIGAFAVEVLAEHPEMDVAVLVTKEPADLPLIPLLDREPRFGEPVLISGFPGAGAGLSLTDGRVCTITSRGFWQSSATATPGNSGGPVLTPEGVLGIVVRYNPGGLGAVTYFEPSSGFAGWVRLVLSAAPQVR